MKACRWVRIAGAFVAVLSACIECAGGVVDACGTPVPAADHKSIRGPFPILSVPYRTDGSIDHDVLVKEARFVADAGVNGFIWCQSNDAVDLLSVE